MYHQLLSVLALAATATAKVIDVQAGKGGALKFEPSEITADVGDTLAFHFWDDSGPHDVSSGDFDSPCKPKSGGFYSGEQEGDADGVSSFLVKVTSTDPIYFYCSVNSHCKSGMVGAVNAPSGKKVAQYLEAARKPGVKAETPKETAGGNVSAVTAPIVEDKTTSKPKAEATSSKVSTRASGAAAAATGTSNEDTTITSSKTVTPAIKTTTTGSGAAAATDSNGSLINSASATATSQAASALASISASASTTPNAAGKPSEGVVLGGFVAILGGLVALMA